MRVLIFYFVVLLLSVISAIETPIRYAFPLDQSGKIHAATKLKQKAFEIGHLSPLGTP